MANNLTIASPDFDSIKNGDDNATANAIRLLWFILNDEAKTRRMGVRQATDRSIRKTLTDAPAANQNNYATGGASIIYFTGSTNFNLTGILGSGQQGERVVIHNEGSGDVTIKHNSGSSDPLNRITTASGADVVIDAGESFVVHYLGGLWREMKLA